MATCNYSSSGGVSELGIEFQSDEELAAVGLFHCYSKALLCFASACCVVFMLIGIPGNLTTIIALARCRKVRNATAIFIINLHVSDLIFCSLILPMSAMTFSQGRWTHGWVMCRVYAYCKYVLNATSIFTILAITINRYVIVCHPLWYPSLYKKRHISIMLLMIWASAMAIFMASNFGAWGRFELEPNGGFCTMLEDKNDRSPKKFFLIIAFVGPYLTIVLCYARIWWVVRQTAKKAHSQNPKPARPTHLPLSHTQSDISNDGNTLISCDPSSPVSSASDDDKTPNCSETTTPNEEKPIEKYFKAPFRQTRKFVKSKLPTSRDKRLCAMIVAIMISFCISHLPIMVTRLVYKEYKSEPVANVFAHMLEYLGTCMNPIIYVLMSKEYRQAYKSLFEAMVNKFQRCH